MPSKPRRTPDAAPRLLPTPTAPAAQAASAAARAYQQQCARMDKLTVQLAELEALTQAHRQGLTVRLHPLTQRRDRLMNDLALWLDGQLCAGADAPPLTPAQRDGARLWVCELAEQLVRAGHAELAAVYDRHSPTTLAERDRAEALRMKAELAALLGTDFVPEGVSPTEVVQAARAHLQQAAQAQAAIRQARAAKRQARRAAKHPPEQRSPQDALADDASATLRGLYRQLASALHPDRAADERERLQKNARMSEANAAYANRDILALMAVHQRADLGTRANPAALGEARLDALTLLLKSRVAELERERARKQDALSHALGGVRPTEASVQAVLQRTEAELTAAVQGLQTDWERVQRPGELGRWLQQRQKNTQALRSPGKGGPPRPP